MKFGALGLGLIIRSLTQLGVLIVSSRVFAPAEIGVAALTFATYHLIWTMFEIAIGQSLLQLDPDDKTNTRALSLLLFGSVTVVLTALVIAMPLILHMDPKTGTIAAIIIAFLVIIRAVGTFSSYGMLRALRIKRYALIEHASYMIGMITSLALCIVFDFGTLYLLLGLLIYSLLATSAFILTAPLFVRPHFNLTSLKRVSRLASGLWIASGLNTFVREANVMFIGILISTEATAQYGRAFQLYMLGNFTIGQLFDRLLTPIFRKRSDDIASNARLFEISAIVLIVLLVPAATLLALESATVIPLFFGPGWEAAVPTLQILCVGLTFRTAMKINESVLRATGYVYTRVGYYLVWAAVLCLGALAAYPYGLVGFAVVEVIGAGLFWALTLRTSLQLYGVKASRLILPVMAGLALALVFWGLHILLSPAPGALRLAIEFMLLLIGAGAVTAGAVKRRFGTLSVLRELR